MELPSEGSQGSSLRREANGAPFGGKRGKRAAKSRTDDSDEANVNLMTRIPGGYLEDSDTGGYLG